MPVVDFPKRYERDMRAKVPLEVIASPPWDPAGAQGAVLDWLYLTYDQPKDVRRAMAAWPATSIVVGRFAGKPPEPQHERVVVVGDPAIEAWRALGSRKAATLIPGDPPSVRDLLDGFARAIGGKARPPHHEVFVGGLVARLGRLFGGQGPAAEPPAGEPAPAAAIERLARRKGLRDGSIVDGADKPAESEQEAKSA
jgi:hypothetical protein